MKRWWWFVVSAVGLLSLAGVGLWSFRHSRDDTQQYNSVGGTVGISDSQVPHDDAQSSSSPGQTTPRPKVINSSSSDQVLGVSRVPASSASLGPKTGQNSGTAEPSASPAGDKSAPGPEEFAQYDAYKNYTEAQVGDIRVGTGDQALAGKTIEVNYRGWLTNGTEFDESYQRGKAFSFVMGQHMVITGWEQGIYGMKIGGKRRLIVPPSVGYGTTDHPPIPANSVLVFDVELVAVH